MRRGGTAIALRNLTLWCLLLTVLGILLFKWALDKKQNYTKLWDKVNRLYIYHEGDL